MVDNDIQQEHKEGANNDQYLCYSNFPQPIPFPPLYTEVRTQRMPAQHPQNEHRLFCYSCPSFLMTTPKNSRPPRQGAKFELPSGDPVLSQPSYRSAAPWHVVCCTATKGTIHRLQSDTNTLPVFAGPNHEWDLLPAGPKSRVSRDDGSITLVNLRGLPFCPMQGPFSERYHPSSGFRPRLAQL